MRDERTRQQNPHPSSRRRRSRSMSAVVLRHGARHAWLATMSGMHRPLLIGLALATLSTAVAAAVYWFRSAVLRSECYQEPVASISDAPEQHIQASLVHAFSLQTMLNESAKLNKWAAIWTGISALLGAITSIYGAF